MRKIDHSLHKAIIHGNLEEIRRLLDVGALPLARNRYGFTGLEMGRFLGCAEAFESEPKRLIKFQGLEDDTVQMLSPEQFLKKTGVRYLPHLQFESYTVFKKVLRQCPWLLQHTSVGRQHKWFGALYRKELLEGFTADASIRWIDEDIGFGLFAEKPLEAQSFVGAYTGIMKRWHRFHPNHNEYCFHYPTGFWRWRIFMIDAKEAGNITRFVNHSDESNLEPVAMLNRGLLHVFFRTVRSLEAGEQMTVNYGLDYWRRREKLKVL